MQAIKAWHPSSRDLIDFAVGKLSEVRAAAVERHLDECRGCVEQVARAPADDFTLLVKGTTRPQTPGSANQIAPRQHAAGLAVGQSGLSPCRLADEYERGGWQGGVLVWYLLSPATLLPLATAIAFAILWFWLH